MIILPLIMIFLPIKKNITLKNLEFNLKNFYNWKVALAKNIYKLYNGFASIIIKECQVGIGSILFIIVPS